ncbi:MAG: FHA domain-containing protein [Propionibacteriaceae bacterium]|jgi:pSer/pThr/pTyr-binding forkhead associated (FHA) protein|nr:FHA domain-containing protein [Propionibacteriaceae bacterium]
MSTLVFAIVKVAFLGLLWLFIAVIAGVIRSDISNTRPTDVAVQPNPKRRGGVPRDVGRLVVIAGKGSGDAVPLLGEIIIGRAADATLDLADDFASNRHARLFSDAQGWVIEDIGSTNGTYVNGVRITELTRVDSRDIIRVGRSQLKLEA